MAETTQDVDDAEEAEEAVPWVQQSPTTRLQGAVSDIIYAGRLDDNTAQNGTSFGLILDNPEVVGGSLWVNQEKGDDETMDEATGDDEPRPTDYRIVDSEDRDTTIANGALVTDEQGPNTYEEADEFAEDSILVWYNGLSGQRIARVLDFNGRPYADWTSSGDGSYLVKGLFQPADGWRENPSQRGEMAQNGKAPRVARAPILRQRVDITYDEDGNTDDVTLLDEPVDNSILVQIGRAQSGRGYRAHVFDATAFADEAGSVDTDIPRDDNGYPDADSELEMQYTAAADTVLEDAEYAMSMYTGDGWADSPSDWEAQSTSAVDSFGISADAGDESGLTASQEQFVKEVVGEVKGTGLTPDEAFEGGLDGLIGKFQDNFDTVPEAADIRGEVFERVSHLDADELGDE